MSVALAEPADLTYATDDRPVRPVLRVVEPLPSPGPTRTRRRGPGVGPAARPRRLRFVAPPPARGGSCRPPAPAAAAASARPTSWRLTERGVAVVLVVAAALVAASVAVVALTALRVTGESYHPGQAAPVQVVAQP